MQLNINGIETRYVLSNEGGGPWLTFIHQLGGDLSVWDPLAGYFRDDFTVLRYDVRGHGATAVPEQPFKVTDLSRDLATLLARRCASSTCATPCAPFARPRSRSLADTTPARRQPSPKR